MRGVSCYVVIDTASSQPEEAVFASSGKKEGSGIMWLDEIKTRFVRDRIRESSWGQRGYAYDLHLIEELLSGARMGWAFHVSGAPKRLLSTNAAEAESIRRELKEGRYIDPETFHRGQARLAAEWDARRHAQAEEKAKAQEIESRLEEDRREAELQKEREAWLLLGGQP